MAGVQSGLLTINMIDSLPASGKYCRVLLIIANSLYPDQARQNVWPDLDPICLALGWCS